MTINKVKNIFVIKERSEGIRRNLLILSIISVNWFILFIEIAGKGFSYFNLSDWLAFPIAIFIKPDIEE